MEVNDIILGEHYQRDDVIPVVGGTIQRKPQEVVVVSNDYTENYPIFIQTVSLYETFFVRSSSLSPLHREEIPL